MQAVILVPVETSILSESESLCDYIQKHYLPYYKEKPIDRIKSDLYRINAILQDPIANIDIQKLNRNDFIMFFQRIEKRNVSRATMNRYRARLAAIMNHAMYAGIIKNNPIKQIRQYKEQPRKRSLNLDEIKILLEECKKSANKYLYLVVMIALYTGMRKGEILNLEMTNISQDYINLRDGQTKSGYSRVIPLHNGLIKYIGEHLNGKKDIGKMFGFKSIRTSWENAVKRSKLKDFRFHDLRRTCATWLKDSDVNIHTISKLLGHSSITMTERYLANDTPKIREAISKLSFVEK